VKVFRFSRRFVANRVFIIGWWHCFDTLIYRRFGEPVCLHLQGEVTVLHIEDIDGQVRQDSLPWRNNSSVNLYTNRWAKCKKIWYKYWWSCVRPLMWHKFFFSFSYVTNLGVRKIETYIFWSLRKWPIISQGSTYSLVQRLLTCGPRTPGGPRLFRKLNNFPQQINK
jgi:hypothetical protein